MSRWDYWLRWYVGTSADPKWLMVKSLANMALEKLEREGNGAERVSRTDVIAMWALMLECAAHPDRRGNCTHVLITLPYTLDLSLTACSEILVAMRQVGVIKETDDGYTLITNWGERQFENDIRDPTGAERKRRFRERHRDDKETNAGHQRNGGGTERNTQSTDTDTDKREPPTPKTRKQPTSNPAFEQFWQAYPKRAGGNPKQPARLAFELAIRKGAIAEAIIAAASAFASNPTTQSGTRFVPMAVTWLHQYRWEDEPAEAPNPYTAMSRDPLPVPTDPRKALVRKLSLQSINRKSDQQAVPRDYPPETDDEWLTLLQGWQVGIIPGIAPWPTYAGGRGSEPDKAACKAPRHLFEQIGLEPPPSHPEAPAKPNGGPRPKPPPTPDEQRALCDLVLANALVLDGPPPGHPGSLISAQIAREKGLIQ